VDIMNNKIATATIALSALMLALAPAVMSQVSAFPGENGQGHTKKTDCDHGPEGQGCPGKSEDADDHFECTTTFAGKSDNIKFTDCPP
jgi:hypothetical protein